MVDTSGSVNALGTGARIRLVRDNTGRVWLIDTATKSRYEVAHPDPKVVDAMIRAATTLYGPMQSGVYLTGWNDKGLAYHLYGGAGGIEKVVAGMTKDPFTGVLNPTPQSVKTVYQGTYNRVVPAPTQTNPDAGGAPPRDWKAEASRLYPFLPDELLTIYANAWSGSGGDASLALAEMRQAPQYDTYFPDNRRGDGSFRMTESDYYATKEGYRTSFKGYGIDPAMFEQQFQEWIKGDVSAREAQERLDSMYVNVLSRGHDVRQFYAQNYGTGQLSDAAIMASVISGENPLILEKRFRASQIGGEAFRFGYLGYDAGDAERLAEAGLGQEAARSFFGKARSMLPTLGSLLKRHNDPDDAFTLDELEDALIFADPDKVQQIQRLYGTEESSFSPVGLFQSNQAGALPGLVAR